MIHPFPGSFFVTGSGTEIGKSFVTAALIYFLKQRGMQVNALKPLISGWDESDFNNDARVLSRALMLPDEASSWQRVTLWRFAAPLAPSMAAAREQITLSLENVMHACKKWLMAQQRLEKKQILLVEGAGGVMSPLDPTHSFLDLISALELPVIFVAGSYLGAISHALTAYEVLRYNNINIACCVVNESVSSIGVEETMGALKPYLHCPVFSLPRIQESIDGWQLAADFFSEDIFEIFT